MKPTKKAKGSRQPRKLPDDACPECGTVMRPSTAELGFTINGEKVSVPDVSHLACPSCGEVVLRYEESKAMQARAAELYRSSHSLLSAAEIRALRRSRNLTQAQLAALLQLGLNTVSRWESGRNVQSGAMDILLKVLRDVPGALEYLKRTAA